MHLLALAGFALAFVLLLRWFGARAILITAAVVVAVPVVVIAGVWLVNPDFKSVSQMQHEKSCQWHC